MSENKLSGWGAIIRREQGDNYVYLVCQNKQTGVNEWVLPKRTIESRIAKRKQKKAVTEEMQELTAISPLKYIEQVADIRYAMRPEGTAQVVIKDVSLHLLEDTKQDTEIKTPPQPADYAKSKWVSASEFKKYLKYNNELRSAESAAGLS